LGSELADGFGSSMFGIAAVSTSVPFMAASGGGSLLMFSAPESVKMGAVKFAIGFVSDVFAQLTVNEQNSKLNIWEASLSGGASMFGLNTYVGAAVSNAVQVENNSYIFPGQARYSVSTFALNALSGGLFGTIGNKVLPKDIPKAGKGIGNNGAQSVSATIVNYWAGSASGGAAQSISEFNKNE
jgi:hypothetical protein